MTDNEIESLRALLAVKDARIVALEADNKRLKEDLELYEKHLGRVPTQTDTQVEI